MADYTYVHKAFQPGEGETINIRSDAKGITVSTFGDPEGDGHVHVKYLVTAVND